MDGLNKKEAGNNMKFLITGGAGFIGSNFLNIMVNKYPKDTYICLDSLTYAGNLENIKNIFNKPNFKFIKEDITNKEGIDAFFAKEHFDIVINFAAESHVDRSLHNPDIFLKTNVLGTLNLLNASLKYNVKRFHQISTDEVYGDLPLDRKDLKFNENTPLNPHSPYSVSKASADMLVLSYYKSFNLPVSISRCSNNYGPYQFIEKLIPLMIDNALNNKELPVYGDGKNVRDWLHVYDHCEAIDLIVRNSEIGKVYNIGGNNELNNLEIINIILNELNKSDNLIKFVDDRKGHDRRYAIDATKIKEELNWSPSIEFKKGIKDTIQWYLNNQEWIKNLKNGEYLNWINKHYK